jgi:glucose-1-phosphate adenylyltransferase
MGVYIFNWDILRDYLMRDSENKDSESDFGKDVIPMMLAAGEKMYAYRFDGYWRDVGTIQAFWESNMDLIQRVPEFNLYDPSWRIYTPNPVMPAHYIGPTGSVKTSIIAEGCKIHGTVRNSVVFPGVVVEAGAEVVDSIIMTKSWIRAGSRIHKCVVGEQVKVGCNVLMGFGPDIPNEYNQNIYNSGITVAGEKSTIPDNTEIGINVMIDHYVEASDFKHRVIESGQSVFRGGEING